MPKKKPTKRTTGKITEISHVEKAIERKLDKMLIEVDHVGLNEYMSYLKSPSRIIWSNLLLGTARGFGIILGMTVVVTLVGLVVQYLSGVPLIGEFFQWIGEMLNKKVSTMGA